MSGLLIEEIIILVIFFIVEIIDPFFGVNNIGDDFLYLCPLQLLLRNYVIR